MPSREEIKATLSAHSTNERQWATRRYANVMPGYDIAFRNRAADKTVDSHDEFDGRRVTFLAQDGSIPEKPFYTGEAGNRGHLEVALNTALGALANRLKPDWAETAAQSLEYKERRLIVAESMFEAALWALALEPASSFPGIVYEDLDRFLYASGQRERVGDHLISAASGNMINVTRQNIETALEKAGS